MRPASLRTACAKAATPLRADADVAGAPALQADRGSHRGEHVLEVADDHVEVLDLVSVDSGALANARHGRIDLVRGTLGLLRQDLHLAGDDAKTSSRRSGTRRLYRRIEREEIGLRGDGGDHLDRSLDLADRARQVLDAVQGGA